MNTLYSVYTLYIERINIEYKLTPLDGLSRTFQVL